MPVRFLLPAVLLFSLLACDEPPVSVPDFAPFSELGGELQFGDPASAISERPGIAVNDEGQFLEYIFARDWLYLFEPHIDSVPPRPTDRLIMVQARERVGDTLSLWSRWHSMRRQLSESFSSEPQCVEISGPLFRITRTEFTGSPAISIGAEIDFHEDGAGYEANLIVSAAEETMAADIEVGFAEALVDCEALPGGIP